jgi:hypothetical protein
MGVGFTTDNRLQSWQNLREDMWGQVRIWLENVSSRDQSVQCGIIDGIESTLGTSCTPDMCTLCCGHTAPQEVMRAAMGELPKQREGASVQL